MLTGADARRMFCQATGFGGTVQQGRTVEAKLAARERSRDEALEAAAAAREVRAWQAATAARLLLRRARRTGARGRSRGLLLVPHACCRSMRDSPEGRGARLASRRPTGVLPAGMRAAPARQHRPPAEVPLPGERR